MNRLVAYAESPKEVYCNGKHYIEKKNGIWRERWDHHTKCCKREKTTGALIREYEREH